MLARVAVPRRIRILRCLLNVLEDYVFCCIATFYVLVSYSMIVLTLEYALIFDIVVVEYNKRLS